MSMGQTRRWWGPGGYLSAQGAQDVEGQLLAVTITVFPGEGLPSEKNLKLNRETACGNDPMNE